MPWGDVIPGGDVTGDVITVLASLVVLASMAVLAFMTRSQICRDIARSLKA
jgi:hypothetical protein